MTHIKPLTGVNLGGWLVAEKWMTPSLFRGTAARNEYELVQLPGGRERLQRHHQTFITEADIKWLAEQKVQLLRVPFGHWIFGDKPPYEGAIERLDWIVKMADHYGLQVLLDLHGAPGAQNAKEHSGSGNIARSRPWLTNKSDQEATITMLIRIVKRYHPYKNVWGIELINEPARGRFGLRLARFYRRAYTALLPHLRPGTRVVFSDAFSPLLLTNAIGGFRDRRFPVVMDCHFYYCFGMEAKRRSFTDHLRHVARTRWLIRFCSLFQPIMVGEWSAMLPIAIRSDQTAKFVTHQQRAFSKSVATCFWNYETEGSGRWSFRHTVEKDLFNDADDSCYNKKNENNL